MKKKITGYLDKQRKKEYFTDIYGATAIWLWGKIIPSEVFELQRLIRKSPMGKYITKLELASGERDYWDDYKVWLRRLKDGDKHKDELTPEEGR